MTEIKHWFKKVGQIEHRIKQKNLKIYLFIIPPNKYLVNIYISIKMPVKRKLNKKRTKMPRNV